MTVRCLDQSSSGDVCKVSRFRWHCGLFVLVLQVLIIAIPALRMDPVAFTGNTKNRPPVIYFSGAGIYFWWQLGAAQYMKENCEVDLLRKTSVVGASAGSITSSLLLTYADLNTLPKIAIETAEEAQLFKRKTGLAGVWGSVLRKWLDAAIPENIDVETIKNLQIALTNPSFRRKAKLVSGFTDRADLIEAIMASCHIPVFLDGRIDTTYKGEKVLDGAFWYFVTKDRFTGLPLPSDTERDDIYWIDYTDDEDFLMSVSGNFLELITPEGMYEMIEYGYNFMKREHYYGKLPFAKRLKPNFVTLPIEQRILSWQGVPASVRTALEQFERERIYMVPQRLLSSNYSSIIIGAARKNVKPWVDTFTLSAENIATRAKKSAALGTVDFSQIFAEATTAATQAAATAATTAAKVTATASAAVKSIRVFSHHNQTEAEQQSSTINTVTADSIVATTHELQPDAIAEQVVAEVARAMRLPESVAASMKTVLSRKLAEQLQLRVISANAGDRSSSSSHTDNLQQQQQQQRKDKHNRSGRKLASEGDDYASLHVQMNQFNGLPITQQYL